MLEVIMKKIHHFLLSAVALLLVMTSLTTLAFAAAAEGAQSQKFEDGSYILVTIEYDQPQEGISYFASRSTTGGTKKYIHCDSNDKVLWEFWVHGTFSYNGVTATATGAEYGYKIYDSSWSFAKANATYSGATATATGTFNWLLFPNTVTVDLTCSPKGVLS